MQQETAEPKKPGSGHEKQPIIPSPVAMFREKNFGLKMVFGCPKTSQSPRVWESHAKMLPLHNPGTFANPLKQLATASNFLGFELEPKTLLRLTILNRFYHASSHFTQLKLVYQRCYECFCFLCANQLASTLTSFRQGLIVLPGWRLFCGITNKRSQKRIQP